MCVRERERVCVQTRRWCYCSASPHNRQYRLLYTIPSITAKVDSGHMDNCLVMINCIAFMIQSYVLQSKSPNSGSLSFLMRQAVLDKVCNIHFTWFCFVEFENRRTKWAQGSWVDAKFDFREYAFNRTYLVLAKTFLTTSCQAKNNQLGTPKELHRVSCIFYTGPWASHHSLWGMAWNFPPRPCGTISSSLFGCRSSDLV